MTTQLSDQHAARRLRNDRERHDRRHRRSHPPHLRRKPRPLRPCGNPDQVGSDRKARRVLDSQKGRRRPQLAFRLRREAVGHATPRPRQCPQRHTRHPDRGARSPLQGLPQPCADRRRMGPRSRMSQDRPVRRRGVPARLGAAILRARRFVHYTGHQAADGRHAHRKRRQRQERHYRADYTTARKPQRRQRFPPGDMQSAGVHSPALRQAPKHLHRHSRYSHHRHVHPAQTGRRPAQHHQH